jgi:hypothetical protein
VDGQGRVVTTTTTQTVAVQQITSTNHVTGFNEPVTITLPDPADVATVWHSRNPVGIRAGSDLDRVGIRP